MIIRVNTPATAMLRESLGRNPWLTLGIPVEFAAIIATAYALPEAWARRPEAILIWMGPVILFFASIAGLFSVTTQGAKSGRNGYPSRMFLYPISTARLVAWPMLYATAAMAIGWLGVASLLPRFGFHPPLALGALGVAAAIAWLQAVSWWPFGSNLTQLLAAAFSLPGLVALVAWPMLVWNWGPAVAWVLLPCYIAAAFAVSARGVALDRRGDGRGGRGWLSIVERLERLIERLPGSRPGFASAGGAQLWFEWRGKGQPLFLIVAALSTFFAAVTAGLALTNNDPRLVRGYLSTLLMVPLGMSFMLGSALAKDDIFGKSIALSPFLATRPMTSAALARTKFLAAALALLASIGFTLATLPIWLLATGNLGMAASFLRSVAGSPNPGLSVLVVAAALYLALMSTWKGMIGGMVPALTGRTWITNGLAYLFLAAVLALALPAAWLAQREGVYERALAAVPSVMGVALAIKVVASAVAFRAASRRALISRRTLIVSAAIWAVSAAFVLIVAWLAVRGDGRVPMGLATWTLIAMASALFPPLGRFAAGPLALDWNRHR